MLGQFRGADSVAFILRNLKNTFPANYEKVVKAARQLKDLSSAEEDRFICFLNTLREETTFYNFREWVTYFRGTLPSDDFLSPEFTKGWTLLTTLGQGAADLLRDSESYTASLRFQMGYTFARNESGGHLRGLLGVSAYYQGNGAQLFFNPRLEIRLKDIEASLASIGTIKLITDVNVKKNCFIGGIGPGVELGPLHVDVLGAYQTGEKHWSFQMSFGYIHTF